MLTARAFYIGTNQLFYVPLNGFHSGQMFQDVSIRLQIQFQMNLFGVRRVILGCRFLLCFCCHQINFLPQFGQ